MHRIWMIRNYALSFAAVVLRGLLGLGVALQGSLLWLTFDDIYTTSVWASILVCAVVTEYFIVQKSLTLLLRGRERRAAAIPHTANTP